jgi:SAM-dependent methyltransferase
VAHISDRQTQFSQRPIWKGRKILDFGGNVAGFLVDAGNRVAHDDFWCLDVTRAAIEQGRRKFPQAHFVFYDRYSSYFNPHGTRYLPVPRLGPAFDIIIAFSVFTHTHRNEMLDLVEQLRRLLSPPGLLAFTFSDPSYDRSLSNPTEPQGTGVVKGFEPQLDDCRTPSRRPHPRWCVEIDGVLNIEPRDQLCQQERQAEPGESYCSYFTVDYMRGLFPNAIVRPPINPEWQHCCILRNCV